MVEVSEMHKVVEVLCKCKLFENILNRSKHGYDREKFTMFIIYL